MKKTLIKVKKTKIWYFFLYLVFIPLFNFLWINIINLKGKIIFINYKKKRNNKNTKYLNFKDDDKKIIRNSEKIKKLTNIINSNLNENFLDKMRSKIKSKNYKKDHYLFYQPNFQIDMYPYLSEELKFQIVTFIIDYDLVDETANYLGIMPIIGKISLNLNVPITNSSERGSMLWHKDDFGFKTIDFFMPIKAVNINNGPLYFEKKRNILGVFHKYSNIKKNPKKGERNKIEISEFKKRTNDENVEKFTGNAGDALMIDSFSCYHRGGFCKNQERIMLRVSYHSPDSIDMLDKRNHNNVFRYSKLFKKKDNKLEEFQKHLLFYRPKIIYKLKIPELLIFIIKLFHFKE
jgi:hypothetical protein